jgi:hypothetical protein
MAEQSKLTRGFFAQADIISYFSTFAEEVLMVHDCEPNAGALPGRSL